MLILKQSMFLKIWLLLITTENKQYEKNYSSKIKPDCLIAFTSWDIWRYVNCNCLFTNLWRHVFWNQPYPSNQTVVYRWLKSHDKSLIIVRTKRAFKIKQKALFMIFKGFSLKQIAHFFFGRLELDFKYVKKYNFAKFE